MYKTIKRFTRNCYTCRRANYFRERYNRVLNPLFIPERTWKNISMDYVVGLPVSQGKNAILVVIYRLSKIRHFIPCIAGEKGTTAEETAKMLKDYI